MNSPAIALPLARIRIRIGGGSIGTYGPVDENPQCRRQPGENANTPRAAENPTVSLTRGAGVLPAHYLGVRVHNLAPTMATPRNIVRCLDGFADHVAADDAIVGVLLEPVETNDAQAVHMLLQFSRRDWHWLRCKAVQRRVGFRGARVHLRCCSSAARKEQHRRLHREPRHRVARAGHRSAPAHGP